MGDPIETALTPDLFGDAEVRAIFGAEPTLARFGAFEVALARAQAAEGIVTTQAADAIAAAVASFRPDMQRLRAGAERDGVAVPDYVRQLREAVGAPHAGALHKGTTSQDLTDTATALALREVNDLLLVRVEDVLEALRDLAARMSGPLMSRTRMQDALEIDAAHRIGQWAQGIKSARDRLAVLRPEVEVLQLGGPVGDRRAPLTDTTAAHMARALGLSNAPCWHTDRGLLVAWGASAAILTGACGKLGQDIALMAQMGEIKVTGAGGSSAMAHKRNPIRAEALVTLARQAVTLSGGLAQAMVHEQERSGAAWSLEWLTLPPLAEAAAAALASALTLARSIT